MLKIENLILKPTTKIDTQSVRQLCIDKYWFECGDETKWQNCLDKCSRYGFKTFYDRILSIAVDIYNNSEFENELTELEQIDNICYELMTKSYTYFETTYKGEK